jgi:hypothetical protein
LDHHKLSKMWGFGGVINSTWGKTFITHAQMETLLFYYWWCPKRIMRITMNPKFLPSFLCVFKCFNVHNLNLR